MLEFKIHTIESAPAKSKPSLEGLKQSFGLIPNLSAVMAESPILLNGFVGAFVNFHGGSFSAGEKQVLLLTNAVTNKCEWAVAFHSTLALKEQVNAAVVKAIRDGQKPNDQKLAALSSLTKNLIEKRGHLSQADLSQFIEGGFSKDQIFEVIAGIAVSSMANYAGNIASPQVEAPFQPQAWSKN